MVLMLMIPAIMDLAKWECAVVVGFYREFGYYMYIDLPDAADMVLQGASYGYPWQLVYAYRADPYILITSLSLT